MPLTTDAKGGARDADLDELMAALRLDDAPHMDLGSERSDDPDVLTRAAAAQALSGLTGDNVRTVLLDTVERDVAEVGAAAAEALAPAPEPRTIEVLSSAALRWQGVELHSARVNIIRKLQGLAEVRPELVARHFAAAFLRASPPASGSEEAQLVGRLEAALPPQAREELAKAAVTALTVNAGQDRFRGRRLAELTSETSLGLLVDALEVPERQAEAAAALGVLRNSRAAPALVGLLGSPAPDVRRAAATALGEIRDARTVGALVPLCTDEEPTVRDAARRAIDRMGIAGSILVLGTDANADVAGLLGGEHTAQPPVPRGTRPARSAASAASAKSGAAAAPTSPRPVPPVGSRGMPRDGSDRPGISADPVVGTSASNQSGGAGEVVVAPSPASAAGAATSPRPRSSRRPSRRAAVWLAVPVLACAAVAGAMLAGDQGQRTQAPAPPLATPAPSSVAGTDGASVDRLREPKTRRPNGAERRPQEARRGSPRAAARARRTPAAGPSVSAPPSTPTPVTPAPAVPVPPASTAVPTPTPRSPKPVQTAQPPRSTPIPFDDGGRSDSGDFDFDEGQP